MKDNIKVILFILAFYLFGFSSLYDGLKDYNNKEYDNYTKVIGYFKEVTQADENTYNLVYVYKVNNISYTITSDFRTNILPEVGTKKTIYYNQDNPSIAVLDNTKTNVFSIVMGIIFILFPTSVLVFVLLALNGKTVSNPYKNSIVVGSIFIFFGLFGYYMMSIGGDSISITSVFDAVGLWMLIPILFVISGLYTSITGIVNLIKFKDI